MYEIWVHYSDTRSEKRMEFYTEKEAMAWIRAHTQLGGNGNIHYEIRKV